MGALTVTVLLIFLIYEKLIKRLILPYLSLFVCAVEEHKQSYKDKSSIVMNTAHICHLYLCLDITATVSHEQGPFLLRVKQIEPCLAQTNL